MSQHTWTVDAFPPKRVMLKITISFNVHYHHQRLTSKFELQSAAAWRLNLKDAAVYKKTVGRLSFRYACPRVWNALPSSLTAEVAWTLASFINHLKILINSAEKTVQRNCDIFRCLICTNDCLITIEILIQFVHRSIGWMVLQSRCFRARCTSWRQLQLLSTWIANL